MKHMALLLITFVGATGDSSSGVTGASYGKVKEEAIEVCMPRGEREYLDRLVCPDGAKPTYSRLGNYGMRNAYPEGTTDEEIAKVMIDGLNGVKPEPGSLDHHTVDGYLVMCGEEKHTLFLDMYHCGQPFPNIAPVGFSIGP